MVIISKGIYLYLEMNYRIIISWMILVGSFSCQRILEPETDNWESGIHQMTLAHDGLDRTYTVYIPEGFDENRVYPLVLILHGGGGTADLVIENDNWLATADEQKFIAVFPDGSRNDMESSASFNTNPQTWNDGSERTSIGAVVRQVDDVGFIESLIFKMKDTLSIDNDMIFATGFSNGSSMTFRLARELPNVFEAVAPVAGSDWMQQLVPDTNPPRLLYITGTEDPLNPFEGGDIFIGNTYIGTKPDVEEMILPWTDLLSCENGFTTDTQQDIRTYQFDCTESEQLKMLALIGHGHHWPGSESSLPFAVVGENATSLNANDVIWEFFSASF
ncbi:alpha/beta hydrolase family esterase [Marivirga sp.]|uniref:alpha/beta hydrolase family esterase n=1 Tax=Marivirga sp. TaxID=2018662 RepID=UPI002D7ED622|nr:PHB depolymerase family esterase [Marivirga sp.]HET8861425.1 PHB depolymerase family esterase [Marivirga sp.]